MQLKRGFDWIESNCDAVLPPQELKDIEPDKDLICYTQGKAIIMDNQDMLEAYLDYCKAAKTWWSIERRKLNEGF